MRWESDIAAIVTRWETEQAALSIERHIATMHPTPRPLPIVYGEPVAPRFTVPRKVAVGILWCLGAVAVAYGAVLFTVWLSERLVGQR